MVKRIDIHFCVKNLKMKKKEQNFFDLLQRVFEPQIFSNFPAHDLNFMESEEPEIKSKQASKRERTLICIFIFSVEIVQWHHNKYLINCTGRHKKQDP